MFEFEKLLSENGINENDTDLPRAISTKIAKFRALQKSIIPETPQAEKDEIEAKLDELDAQIMKTLPDYFDIEDEEEIIKAQKIAEKAKKEKEEAEKAKAAADAKAKADKEAADKKAAEEAELNKPATNDNDALDKLYRRGKTSVTEADLASAGFNTGFWGKLGPNGCETKNYRLYRADISNKHYSIIKK